MKDSYEKTGSDLMENAAPRYKISLSSSVLITAYPASAVEKEPYFFLQGQLLDVSRSGLALIISYPDLLELNMMETDLIMQLLLPLPVKAIELEVQPVRYERLDESDKGKVLVGTHITDMNGRDRALFMNFINDYETTQK